MPRARWGRIEIRSGRSTSGGASAFAAHLVPYILVPGVAELLLALWLAARGVNEQRWQEQVREAAVYAATSLTPHKGGTSLNAAKLSGQAGDPGGVWLYRVSGISALLIGIGYLFTIALYVPVGAPPRQGEAWLQYLAGKTTIWWAILGLSVLTDVLFLPVALALYLALKEVNRGAMLVATTLVGLFVALDLAVTWPNHAALITLSGQFAAASSDTERAGSIAAANYASAVLTSGLEAVYSILILSVGILMIGLVMRRGNFGKGTAYVGVCTGILGIVAALGPLVLRTLSVTIIIVSVLTTLWVFLVGFRLSRLGQR